MLLGILIFKFLGGAVFNALEHISRSEMDVSDGNSMCNYFEEQLNCLPT